MSEPEYIRQFGLEEIEKDPGFLENTVYPDARQSGVTWMRLSWDNELRIAVLEGWNIRPEDEGEPRFMVQAVPQ